VDSVHNIGRDSYRLIVTRRDASEFLLVRCESTWSLPSVEIQRGRGLQSNLQQSFTRSMDVRILPVSSDQCRRASQMRGNRSLPKRRDLSRRDLLDSACRGDQFID